MIPVVPGLPPPLDIANEVIHKLITFLGPAIYPESLCPSVDMANQRRDIAYCAIDTYSGAMIKTFAHKGIERFFKTGSKAGIQARHAERLRDQLAFLNSAEFIEDMDVSGWRLHSLKGDRKNYWSITVNKNWRLVFRFEDGDAYVVNYEDYH